MATTDVILQLAGLKEACPDCVIPRVNDGGGWLDRDGEHIDCPECHGTGKVPLIRTPAGESLRRGCICMCHDLKGSLRNHFHHDFIDDKSQWVVCDCIGEGRGYLPVAPDTAFRVVLEWIASNEGRVDFDCLGVSIWIKDAFAPTWDEDYTDYKGSIPATLFAATLQLPQVREAMPDEPKGDCYD